MQGSGCGGSGKATRKIYDQSLGDSLAQVEVWRETASLVITWAAVEEVGLSFLRRPTGDAVKYN